MFPLIIVLSPQFIPRFSNDVIEGPQIAMVPMVQVPFQIARAGQDRNIGWRAVLYGGAENLILSTGRRIDDLDMRVFMKLGSQGLPLVLLRDTEEYDAAMRIDACARSDA